MSVYAKTILKDEKFVKDLAKQIFNEMDSDKSGQIDKSELYQGIQKIANNSNGEFDDPKQADIDDIVDKFDLDNDEKLSLQEFTEVVKQYLKKIAEEK